MKRTQKKWYSVNQSALRDAARRSGMSQPDCMVAVGLLAGSYSNFFHGTGRKVNGDDLRALARGLGLAFDAAVSGGPYRMTRTQGMGTQFIAWEDSPTDAKSTGATKSPPADLVQEAPAVSKAPSGTTHAFDLKTQSTLSDAIAVLETVHSRMGQRSAERVDTAVRYRELVALFSDASETHAAATTKLRQLVHDAALYHQMRAILGAA